MKRIALLLLLAGCVSLPPASMQDGYTRFVIDNQEWQDARVHLWCGSRALTASKHGSTIRVPAASRLTAWVRTDNCSPVHATANLFGSPRSRLWSPAEALRSDQWVLLTIRHNLDVMVLWPRSDAR